jgi:hypothetical protein
MLCTLLNCLKNDMFSPSTPFTCVKNENKKQKNWRGRQRMYHLPMKSDQENVIGSLCRISFCYIDCDRQNIVHCQRAVIIEAWYYRIYLQRYRSQWLHGLSHELSSPLKRCSRGLASHSGLACSTVFMPFSCCPVQLLALQLVCPVSREFCQLPTRSESETK